MCLESFPQLRDDSLWFESGGDTILIPAFSWNRGGGLFRTLHSSFPFVYGGPVPCQAPDGRERLPKALRWLRPGTASVRVAGNPFGGAVRDAAGGGAAGPSTDAVLPRGYVLRPEATHLMDLPESEDAYWAALPGNKRNDVRRLSKKGVTVEESHEEEDIRSFYRLYIQSFEHWGGRPGIVYPERFYRNLVRLGGTLVRFLVARHEGRLLGGSLFVRWNGKVHYLAGYFDREARALRPNVLIQLDSILQSIREGYGRYDFLPSAGIEAVEAFKESFGGRRTEFPVYECTGAAHRLLRGLRLGRGTG